MGETPMQQLAAARISNGPGGFVLMLISNQTSERKLADLRFPAV
jgi:hypothetical protein